MKKIFSVSVLALLFFSGCRENYKAEKEYWKATKVLAAVTKADLKAKGPEILEPAVQAYQQVAEKFPSTPKAADSLFVIANLRLKQKNFDEAIRVLQNIVTNFSRMQDKPAEARYGIAEIYEATGEWEKAEAAFWELAEYHPLNTKGNYAPVHILIHYKKIKDAAGQKRAYDKALEYYNKMIKQLGPIEISAILKNNLALVYLTQGDWKEARKVWLSIPEEFPNNPYAPTAILAAAELSWKKKELTAAISGYSRFLEAYPKHPMVLRAMTQLGSVYDDHKEYAKAREWFEKALALQQGRGQLAEIRMLMARSYQNEGKWSEAQKIYDEIETQYQDTATALQIPLLKAAHFQEVGQKDVAQNILEGAIAKYQTVMEASSNVATSQYAQRLQNAALAETGDWKGILKNFDRNMSQEKSEVKKGEWLFLKAVVIENRLKDSAQAISLYHDFLTQYPGHPLSKLAKSRIEVLQTTS